MTARDNRSSPARLACLIFSLAALLLVGCGARQSGGSDDSPTSPDAAAVPIAAVRLQPTQMQRELRLSSVVEPQAPVRLAARASGSLLVVEVEEGDHVRRGQRLAQIDVAEQQAELDRARARVAEARQAYGRIQELRSRQLVSEADYQAATAAVRVAEGEAALWATRVGFGRIESPLDGVVLARHVRLGDSVDNQQTLFELADLSELVLQLAVSELDVVHLAPGHSMAVSIDALPALALNGTVRRVFPAADASSRLVTVELTLPGDAFERDVRPGFLARVHAVMDRREDALSVPVMAVGNDAVGDYVMTVVDDRLRRRDVVTGLRIGDWIEIASGLEVGHNVLATSPNEFAEGQWVRVVSWRERPRGG